MMCCLFVCIQKGFWRWNQGFGSVSDRGYRKLRQWNQGFGSVSGSLGVRRYIQEEEVGRWSCEGPTRVGARIGRRPALLPRGHLVSFLTSTPSPLDHVCSKNHAPEGFIPFGLRLIFLFCETLKQAKKQQFALVLRLIGESQKYYKNV